MNIKISVGDEQVYHEAKFLKEYAREHKNELLHEVNGGIIVSNWSGWCTIVSKRNSIYHAWAGEIQLDNVREI